MNETLYQPLPTAVEIMLVGDPTAEAAAPVVKFTLTATRVGAPFTTKKQKDL